MQMKMVSQYPEKTYTVYTDMNKKFWPGDLTKYSESVPEGVPESVPKSVPDISNMKN